MKKQLNDLDIKKITDKKYELLMKKEKEQRDR